jgi:hypothetical protein
MGWPWPALGCWKKGEEGKREEERKRGCRIFEKI